LVKELAINKLLTTIVFVRQVVALNNAIALGIFGNAATRVTPELLGGTH